MKIRVTTALGQFTSTGESEATTEQLQEFLEELYGKSPTYLTLKTATGPVIIGGELLKNSVVEIIA